MATNNGDLLTPEIEAEIQSLAKEENRSATEVLEAALKAYRLQRLAAYGRAKTIELGLRPRSEAHAETHGGQSHSRSARSARRARAVVRGVTADTNVYVSALAFGGKPLQILEMAAQGLMMVTAPP